MASFNASPTVKRIPIDTHRVRAAQLEAQAVLARAMAALSSRPSTTALIKRKIEDFPPVARAKRRVNLNDAGLSESTDSLKTPEIEWWDALLPAELDALIFYPVPRKGTAESTPGVVEGRLTPKEREKLGKIQRRAEIEEIQRKIKAGEISAPPNKTKLRNLARVLGTAADPSASEIALRQNIAQRILDNEAMQKKKTPTIAVQKNSKTDFCAVFNVDVREISDHQRFKVTKNAKQLALAGVAVKMRDRKFLVVVQGEKKHLKKFSSLILRRIKWATPTSIKDEEESDFEDEEDKISDVGEVQSVVAQVWTGPVVEKSQFRKFRWLEAASEDEAKRSAGRFWNFAEHASPK